MQIDLAQLCKALVFLMSCCAMAWNFCPATHNPYSSMLKITADAKSLSTLGFPHILDPMDYSQLFQAWTVGDKTTKPS